MTQENLINLACRWLDFNQSKYISETFTGRHIVAGSCQTDLRNFLLYCAEKEGDEEIFYQDIIDEYEKNKEDFISKFKYGVKVRD